MAGTDWATTHAYMNSKWRRTPRHQGLGVPLLLLVMACEYVAFAQEVADMRSLSFEADGEPLNPGDDSGEGLGPVLPSKKGKKDNPGRKYKTTTGTATTMAIGTTTGTVTGTTGTVTGTVIGTTGTVTTTVGTTGTTTTTPTWIRAGWCDGVSFAVSVDDSARWFYNTAKNCLLLRGGNCWGSDTLELGAEGVFYCTLSSLQLKSCPDTKYLLSRCQDPRWITTGWCDGASFSVQDTVQEQRLVKVAATCLMNKGGNCWGHPSKPVYYCSLSSLKLTSCPTNTMLWSLCPDPRWLARGWCDGSSFAVDVRYANQAIRAKECLQKNGYNCWGDATPFYCTVQSGCPSTADLLSKCPGTYAHVVISDVQSWRWDDSYRNPTSNYYGNQAQALFIRNTFSKRTTDISIVGDLTETADHCELADTLLTYAQGDQTPWCDRTKTFQSRLSDWTTYFALGNHDIINKVANDWVPGHVPGCAAQGAEQNGACCCYWRVDTAEWEYNTPVRSMFRFLTDHVDWLKRNADSTVQSQYYEDGGLRCAKADTSAADDRGITLAYSHEKQAGNSRWLFLYIQENPFIDYFFTNSREAAYFRQCHIYGQLDWMKQQLKANPDKPTLIFVHNMNATSKWDDGGWKEQSSWNLFTNTEFADVIKGSSVVGIFAGHTHCDNVRPLQVGYNQNTDNPVGLHGFIEDIPVFNAGAVWCRTQLVVEAHADQYVVETYGADVGDNLGAQLVRCRMQLSKVKAGTWKPIMVDFAEC